MQNIHILCFCFKNLKQKLLNETKWHFQCSKTNYYVVMGMRDTFNLKIYAFLKIVEKSCFLATKLRISRISKEYKGNPKIRPR